MTSSWHKVHYKDKYLMAWTHNDIIHISYITMNENYKLPEIKNNAECVWRGRLFPSIVNLWYNTTQYCMMVYIIWT